jgi:hypothetical protein
VGESLQIISHILSLFPETSLQAAGAGIQLGLGKWQEGNLNRFKTNVEFQLKTLNQKKIDRAYLYSDQFKELLVGFIEGSSKTASEVKHRAFANALKNSVYEVSPGFSDKPVLQRILLQMSEGEIEALLALFKETESQPDEDGEIKHNEKGIATLLTWSRDDTDAALLSLSQLGLAEGGMIAVEDRVIWNTSTLARRLAVWCSENIDDVDTTDTA